MSSSTRSSVEEMLIEAATKVKRFTRSDLEIFTSNFTSEVGSGASGKVYKGQFSDGVKIAVKVLLENRFAEETFMAELRTICLTSHRFVVELYGFCFDENIKALVYEYMENGSLDKILYENKFGLDWEKLHSIAIDTAKGLSYLHVGCLKQIIHHDVKASNVLLDSNFCPKLTDFGLAKRFNVSASHRTNTAVRGTPHYVAPEMLYPFARVSCKSDVYSFGMLLFEILGKRNNGRCGSWFPLEVWKRFDIGQLGDVVIECGIREISREKAKTLSMVALWCAQYTPKLRPSMSIVVKMLEGEIPVEKPPNPFPYCDDSTILEGDSYMEEIQAGPSVNYVASPIPDVDYLDNIFSYGFDLDSLFIPEVDSYMEEMQADPSANPEALSIPVVDYLDRLFPPNVRKSSL